MNAINEQIKHAPTIERVHFLLMCKDLVPPSPQVLHRRKTIAKRRIWKLRHVSH